MEFTCIRYYHMIRRSIIDLDFIRYGESGCVMIGTVGIRSGYSWSYTGVRQGRRLIDLVKVGLKQ